MLENIHNGKIYIVKWDGSDYWADQAYSVGEKIQKGVALHDYNDDGNDGLKTITNLNYTIDGENINIKTFNVPLKIKEYYTQA